MNQTNTLTVQRLSPLVRSLGVLACLLLFVGGCGDDASNTNQNDNGGNSNGNGECGDGIVQEGEVCDEGPDNSDTVADACRTSCQPATCGDGVVDQDETCDNGTSNSDTEADACRTDCQVAFCGDGVTDGDEDCDDADDGSNPPDDCPADCAAPACGDGHLWLGVETCDDGSANSDVEPDACRLDCSEARCGDGVVDSGEHCDDADDGSNPPDACPSDCATPICGDGHLWLGVEACDDGNTADGDNCRADCLQDLTLCGNGTMDSGEACDDGNTADGDDCRANCSLPVVVGAGETHTCATRSGSIYCWGGGFNDTAALGGQLGYGNVDVVGDTETPAQYYATIPNGGAVDVGGATIVGLALGDAHTCGRTDQGTVRCWGVSGVCCGWIGTGNYGPIGYGVDYFVGDDETPAQFYAMAPSGADVELGGTVTQLDAGAFHNCAVMSTGSVRCWGAGWHAENFGELGYGTWAVVGDNETPYEFYQLQPNGGDVSHGGGTAVQVATGGFHTCVLLDTGVVRCWGLNEYGCLGYGTLDQVGRYETPQDYYVYNLPSGTGDVDFGAGVAVQVTAGINHTCVVLDTGDVRCWGANFYGQLGYGNTADIGDNETPAQAYASLPNNGNVDLGGPATAVSAGDNHTCALMTTGAVRCWGDSWNGALGYGNTTEVGDNETPAQFYATMAGGGDVVLGGTAQQVVAHREFTCAVLAGSDDVLCWGKGTGGQLGQASTNNIGDNETPASVGPISF